MGDSHQLDFARDHAELLRGPYLEIGSQDYGNTQPLRSVFAASGEEYVGIDMLDGPGVDRVVDLLAPFETIDKQLDHRRFGSIFSFSVMEHCENPFRMAEHMTRLLAPGGHICLSVPFAWEFHGYPSDYWRFTVEGIKKLFPDIEWVADSSQWHSTRPSDVHKMDPELGVVYLKSRMHRQQGRYWRAFEVALARTLGRIGVFPWLFRRSRIMLPTMIDMIGTRRA